MTYFPTDNGITTPNRSNASISHQDSPIAEFSTSDAVHEFSPAYINRDLSSEMDGVIIDHDHNNHMVTDTNTYDDAQTDISLQHYPITPPASPTPDSFMPNAKRHKGKRGHQQQQTDAPAAASKSSDRDLVVRAPSAVHSLDLIDEVKFLRAELEKSRIQNDKLNKKILRMAEGAAVLNQLQQYMHHLKILPSSYEEQQALAVSKEVALHHGQQRPLGPAEMQNMAPFGAFRDACTRYPHLPIALFNISLPTPVVVLANETFNTLFATDARSRPWIHFIAPSHLERTKQLLFRALSDHDAIRFVQVYKGPSQKQFLALDMHRFYQLPPTANFGSSSVPQIMDLVFLVTNPNLKYPPADDFTFWKAPLNDQGIIAMEGSSVSFANASDSYIADSLTSSSGISFEPYGNDTHAATSSNSGLSLNFGSSPPSNRIDILNSPSVTEVTTPPQDHISEFTDMGAHTSVMNASPRMSASPLDSTSWMATSGPTGEYGINSGAWYEPTTSTSPWQPSDWSSMNVSGNIPIPPYGFGASPPPSDRRVEEIPSPSSPGYAAPATPHNTPVPLGANPGVEPAPSVGSFSGLTASQELGLHGGHFPPFSEDFDAL